MSYLNCSSWDNLFMNICDTVAAKSKDRSTKIGCVIVGPDNEVRSMGFNGFPRGFKDKKPCTFIELEDGTKIPQLSLAREAEVIDLRFERPLKYKTTEHGERNALYNAARVGIPMQGCTLYVNSLPPCVECARGIIQSGIIKVVHVEAEIPERWREDCAMASEMLRECGIGIMTIKRKGKTT